MQVVIYKQDNGRVAIVRPTVQDVPAGKPFKIIDAALVPAERAARDAWQVEDAELTDGVGTGAWPL
jgi:hypothetical protein